jgi:hypothetical protein
MRWRARIDYFTAAKVLRHWEGEVVADTAELASEDAMQAFRRSRDTLQIPEISDFQLEPPEEKET